MDSDKKIKSNIVYKKVVPRSHNILAAFSGVIILLGLIEGIFFFSLSLMDAVIAAAVLLVFYIFLLAILLKPKTIRVIRKRNLKKDEANISKEVTKPAKTKKGRKRGRKKKGSK